MAILTKTTSVDNTAYTIIGSNVSSLAINIRGNATIAVVVVPTGAAAPALGTDDLISVANDFSMALAAADVYARGNNAAATKIEVLSA